LFTVSDVLINFVAGVYRKIVETMLLRKMPYKISPLTSYKNSCNFFRTEPPNK